MIAFYARHAYGLLMWGSLLDAVTTWVAIEWLGGRELAPLMAYCMVSMGVLPALAMKMGLTGVGGRVMLRYSPVGLRVLSAGVWVVGAWNLGGIAAVLYIVHMGV